MREVLEKRSLDLLSGLAGVGYFEVDAERNVVAMNPVLERITGFSADEVIGRPCITLIRCQDCLRRCGVFAHGRFQHTRLQIYRKDGSEVEVYRSGVAIRDEAGTVVGALETVRLPGEGAGAMQRVPQELDVLLRGLGRMFIAADAEFRVRAFSPSLAELTGWSGERLQDAPLSQLFGDDLFGADGVLRTAVLAGRRREGWHASLPAPGGARCNVSISVGAISPEDRCGHEDVRVVLMIRPEEPLAGALPDEEFSQGGVVGRSAAMRSIYRLIDLLRDNDATVLITGESGTGKEVIARALHASSHRASGPFVAVNCAALPSELLESELFGHVRGAFTGAVRDRIGRFERAQGGTILLDEIADLAPALQAKILRVIQERTFERVGDTQTRTADVRVIAATHVNLARAVAEHRFREDLYYRLRVIPIEIPPLRERREDLPVLIDALLQRIARTHQRCLRLAGTASRALLGYDWPGNVRELENALEYAVTVCTGQTIHLDDLPAEIRTFTPAVPHVELEATSGSTFADERERERIRSALVAARYQRGEAATALGMSRTTLWRKMKEHGL